MPCITVDHKGKNAKLMPVLDDYHDIQVLDHYGSPSHMTLISAYKFNLWK
jgi:hypothetical protein